MSITIEARRNEILQELQKLPLLKKQGYKVSFHPTQTRTELALWVVDCDKTESFSLDNWAIWVIHSLYWDVLLPIFEDVDLPGERILFRQKDKIVFYTPHTLVLKDMKEAPQGDWYGNQPTGVKFVAENVDVNKLIEFLTTEATYI